MIISTSNQLAGVTPIVSFGGGTDQPANITNLDFALNYTASSPSIIIDFGALSASCVGVVAFNVGSGYISVVDGIEVISTLNITHDQVVMLTFDERVFSNMKVIIISQSGTLPTVQYIAAGDSWELPHGGEQAGYKRMWLSHGVTSRIKENDQGFPTAELLTNTNMRLQLSIPNLTIDELRNYWLPFIDFAERDRNHFFIKESDDYQSGNLTCVVGFGIKTSGEAHSETRALNNVQAQFRGLNKIYV